MAEVRDWRQFRDANAQRLLRQTGQDVAAWNARIAEAGITDPQALDAWLAEHGVGGYSQQLLRWERFGYPDFATASADSLVDAQYADRPALRPIHDAVIAAALSLGDVAIQARKTYVSLLTPRRTFARVQAGTRARLDVGLRLEGLQPGGRLRPCRMHETLPLQLSLASLDEFDDEARDWLRRARDQNA